MIFNIVLNSISNVAKLEAFVNIYLMTTTLSRDWEKLMHIRAYFLSFHTIPYIEIVLGFRVHIDVWINVFLTLSHELIAFLLLT